ncbi:MAG TPA: 50S ribosomal protein L21 [Chitinophagaceae bacterium]|nr:50S ribosomal protein L21 [Chitinophagaceae bacterium]
MFAVVTIAGQQFKVKQNDELYVHRLQGEAGDQIELKDVLMTSTNGNITIGKDVASTVVKAEIIDHLKGDKVLVFKKKRRKGYKKLKGHRQYLTKIKIQSIA